MSSANGVGRERVGHAISVLAMSGSLTAERYERVVVRRRNARRKSQHVRPGERAHLELPLERTGAEDRVSEARLDSDELAQRAGDRLDLLFVRRAFAHARIAARQGAERPFFSSYSRSTIAVISGPFRYGAIQRSRWSSQVGFGLRQCPRTQNRFSTRRP